MKKTRILILTLIMILAIGCPVFAETFGTGAPHTSVDTTHTFYHSYVDQASYGYMYYDEYIDTSGHLMLCKDTNLFYILVPKSLSNITFYHYQNRSAAGMSSDWQTAFSGPTSSRSKFSNDRFQILFLSSYYPTTTSRKLTESYNVDYVFDTFSEMTSYCEENVDSLIDSDGNIIIPEPEPPKEVLPNFTYKVSKKWHPHWTTNILQYNFYANWNCKEFERYSESPNNFYVECKAQSQGAGLNTLNAIFIDKQPIVSEEISFSISDAMNKIIDNPLPNAPGMPDMYIPYYVMLRVVSADNSLCSDWHFYLVEPQSGNRITDSGSFSENDSGDLDNTVPPTDDDVSNIDNSNFHKDENGGNTSASRNPDSSVYKESSSVDSQSLVSNLKSSVQSIKDISSMLSVCYEWLPSWLLSLIACSIGIIVVVGVVNIIRG